MVSETTHLLLEVPPDRPAEGAVVEEREVLGPREPDQDTEAVVGRLVEQCEGGGV